MPYRDCMPRRPIELDGMEEIDMVRERQSAERFARPGAPFRPAAYWFWHSLPSPEQMREQLTDFRDKGFATILIQARLALPRSDYLSPDFIRAYAQATAIMADLGLVAGLYDDYNWTSGQAGGRTVEGADHLRERHLFWSTVSSGEGVIDGIEAPFARALGPDIGEWLYEDGAPSFDEWQAVAAVLHPADGAVIGSCQDVSDRLTITPRADGCDFRCEAPIPEGFRLTVFLAARCRTSRIINYLLPEAGERFVAVGLEPLADALGSLMPDPLQFLFFDQPAPNFYSWRQRSGALGNSLLFADHLAKTVETQTGVPFFTALLALVIDLGPDSLRIRCRFFEAYTGLMYEGFFRPLRDFTQKYRIRLAGHEILPHVGSFALNGGFTSIDPRVVPAVDFFGLDALRDETAVDANNFVAQLAPKLGDSVARASGRSRTTAELYATALRTERRGAGQWELTPSTLRAQSIRLLLLGARQVIFHGLYQTDGHDDDPRLFVNPRFDFAPGLNFEPWWPHHGAIAEETARLSVFLEDMTPDAPVALLYPLHTAWAEGPWHPHARHFGAWCEALNDHHCAYMIVDEDSLAKAEIRDGRLHVNGLVFAAIALPSISIFKTAKSADILEAFRMDGGMIWVSGEHTSRACDGEARFETTDVLADEPDAGSVAAVIATLPATVLDISTAKAIRHVSGTDADGFRRVVFFNDSDESRKASISAACGLDYEIWDAAGGTAGETKQAGKLSMTLLPQQLVCLRIRQSPEANRETVRLSAETVPDRTAVLVDGWRFSAETTGTGQPISVDGGWQQQGYAAFSGTGIYECDFELETTSNIVLDLPGVATAATVTLDGRLVGSRSFAPYCFDLGKVEAGSHRLQLHVSNTAANRYYADTPYAGSIWPDESGLLAPPRLLFFSSEQIKD
jgi:hypothetical protein